jgi:hypothetical protein
MATSQLERFTLGALPLNDQTNFVIESLIFTPAAKKPQYADNADADGEVLVRESHYSNSSFEMLIRVAPQSTALVGLEKLGELTDAVQQCEREEDGQQLAWTPHDTEDEYLAYARSGEVSELPIEVTGDTAGWFLKSPLVRVKLTCRPFLYKPERIAKSATESGAEPLQTLYAKVGGDVPAEARLIFKDKATQDRRYVQWGRDVVPDESNPALLITAASLTTTGFSGEAKTRSGAYSEEKVKRATAVSSATTMAGTGRIEHVGTFAVYLRVYATSEDARFRISYRNGDGPLVPLNWKQPPVIEGFSDIYMGEVSLDEVDLGMQTSEIRIEIMSAGSAIEVDLNYLTLIPTLKGSGKARGLAQVDPIKALVFDDFSQTAGNLEGKALPLGGVSWAETNKTGAEGFKVDGEGLVYRTTGDGSLSKGCFAQAGATSYTGFYATVTAPAGCQFVLPTAESETYLGILARYVSTESHMRASLRAVERAKALGGGYAIWVTVDKRIAGSGTELGHFEIAAIFTHTSQWVELVEAIDLALSCTAAGVWEARINGETILSGTDTDLGSSGTLKTGKVGLYDGTILSGKTATRRLDKFGIWELPEANRVCYSGRQVEFRSDGCLRQDSTGTYDGPPSVYRGANFYLEPEGEAGLINRTVVRGRGNDVEEEADSTVTDKQSVEIVVRERFLIPR